MNRLISSAKTAIRHPNVVYENLPVNVCPILIKGTTHKLLREIPTDVRSIVETDNFDPDLICFLCYGR